MLAAVGLKDRMNFMKYSLTPAMTEGFVCLLYPDKPRHPRQKYLLTVRGSSLYNELTKDVSKWSWILGAWLIHKLSERNRVTLSIHQCDSKCVHFGADINIWASSQENQLVFCERTRLNNRKGSVKITLSWCYSVNSVIISHFPACLFLGAVPVSEFVIGTATTSKTDTTAACGKN